MATWYRTGAVSVTNGSATVTGVDTLWSTQIKQGDVFTLNATNWYEVDVVNSNTSITLKSAYQGTTQSAQTYAIIRNFTNTTNADLAASLAALLTKWHNREDELVDWLTLTGTVTLTKTDNTTVDVKTPTQIQNEWIGKVTKALTNIDVTLTAGEAGNAFLFFTGTLTGNVNVIVPTSQSHVWLIQNNCTGAFTVTVKTAAGTGVVVDQGIRYCLYCDGTNVVSGATNAVGTAQTNTPTNSMLGTAAYTNIESLTNNVFTPTATQSTAFTVHSGMWGQTVAVSGTTTVTLPAASTMLSGFNVRISNTGTSTLTIARTGADTIDGSSLNISVGRGMEVEFYVNSSTDWRTTKAPQFGWKDITSWIHTNAAGAGDPSWTTYRDGIHGYSFSATVLQEVETVFHLPHDYAPGTSIYFHTHWTTNSATVGNDVRWGFEYTIAKGHNQASNGDFAATSTVYVAQSVTAQYRHMVAETTAISSAALEPDALILMRVFRDAANGADTYTQPAFLLAVDIHYQADRYSTPNKVPNFYL